MELIQNTTEFRLEKKSAVAIGKFDGIHLGHQELLGRILEHKKQGLAAVIFTFDPPPAVFFGQTKVKELTTREEKRRIFKKLGIDVLIEFPLNEQTARTSPEDFITEILVKRLNVSYLAAGEDLSFGYLGKGNCKLLERFAGKLSFQTEMIPKICMDGKVVSSSYIREEVTYGHMENVEKLIGFPYSVTGIVVHGKQFGRTIGMPTVNLLPPEDKLLPPRGVYYSNVSYNGKHYQSISNIGWKPTVSEERVMGVETYLYDFDEELYGKEITVKLLGFKRPEMKFESKEHLKAQMQKDIEEGRR